MSKDKKEPSGDPGSQALLIGVGIIVLALAGILYSSMTAAEENTLAVLEPVPIVAADDTTATAGTIVPPDEAIAPDDEAAEPTADDDGATTFFGRIGDGVCEFAVELGDSWDLEFVKSFTKEHPCDVTITN